MCERQLFWCPPLLHTYTVTLKEKHNFYEYSRQLRPLFFVFFFFSPLLVCTDLFCQASTGAVGGDLWVVGSTTFFCGHSICQAVQTKKKNAALESLYVSHFVMLSVWHAFPHASNPVSVKKGKCKANKESSLKFSWKWWPVSFCPGDFNASGSIYSTHFNYLSSLILDKTDVGNYLQIFTLQSYLIFWNGDLLLIYFCILLLLLMKKKTISTTKIVFPCLPYCAPK